MRSLFILLLVLISFCGRAQTGTPTSEKYLYYIDSASGLYEAEKYQRAAQLYTQAFEANGQKGRPSDWYNAACSWALAGNKAKAFGYLQKAVASGWANPEHLKKDKDLATLHSDPKWPILVKQVQKKAEEREAGMDKALVAQLDTIYNEDQDYRLKIDTMLKQYSWDSPQMQSLWTVIKRKDSINLVKVKSIIDQRGWLGPDVVGSRGNQTLFLVIQHADSATQEAYLPLMRQAVKDGKALPSQLALLEDRTRMNRGQKQLYGSQVINDPVTKKPVFYAIEDEPNVNRRRATMGLGRLETYARNFGMEYVVPKKKKE